MIKSITSVILSAFLVLSCTTATPKRGAKDITGLWKSRDEKVDKPRSLVAIYKYKDMYYGRMLVTYGEDGQVVDTILEQKDKAKGVVGNPPYCGMDFVYDVKSEGGDKYKGKIIDPEKGKVYNAELWREGNDLILRGEIWIFGKNIPWHMASEKDLPKGFSMSQIKDFVPVIPQVL